MGNVRKTAPHCVYRSRQHWVKKAREPREPQPAENSGSCTKFMRFLHGNIRNSTAWNGLPASPSTPEAQVEVDSADGMAR
jgi:hypothetical protein